MSINSVLCHALATSLVDLSTADAYLASHPDRALWEAVPGDDEDARNREKENYLVAASRMISRAPLAAPPLGRSLGWEPVQALNVPVQGHPFRVGTVAAYDAEGPTVTVSTLIGVAVEELAGGALRLGDTGEVLGIVSVDGATGTVALAQTPTAAPTNGTSVVLIERLAAGVIQAVCEQAIYLVGDPALHLLNDRERGVMSTTLGGAGGGSVNMDGPDVMGELCFPARRLLESAGLLRSARSLDVGRG